MIVFCKILDLQRFKLTHTYVFITISRKISICAKLYIFLYGIFRYRWRTKDDINLILVSIADISGTYYQELGIVETITEINSTVVHYFFSIL